ncbi:MAG: hypothetical protein AABO58_15120 [Acidobacteriota bacterium]
MPKQKDLKRLVRARMQKTGESYTTARLQLVKKQPETPTNYEKLAGLSDESVKKATGCAWEKWVFVLDHAEGTEMSHRELAQHIHDKYHTPGWWTQMVAVGYERIRGLRAQGQRRSGEWEVSKSKTVAVPVKKLYAAFKTARGRAKWLADANLTVRTAKPEKSMRVRWEDGTPVDIFFLPRGETKSQVAIQHRKLTSKADADRMRAFWSARLDALAAMMK